MSQSGVKLATQIVHWPGQDTAACDEHAAKLKTLAAHMGFTLSATACLEVTECGNCKNEESKGKRDE